MSRILNDPRSRVPALALAGTLALGCSPQGPGESIGTASQAISLLPDLLVPTGVSMSVNTAIALAADARQGELVLSASPFDLPALKLQAGDLVMLHQTQGAQIATTDDAAYGAVTSLGGAGLYEVFRVSSSDPVTGQIQIAKGCGLRNAYSALGKTQIVRVPRYHDVTLQAGVNGAPPGTLTAAAWNGSYGGILAMRADTVTMDGAISVSGRGFRGGQSNISDGGPAIDQVQYRTTNPLVGAEKGESVAGSQADYDAMSLGGRYGRGAPANGGGGGNNHNSGGGGGANAGDSSTYTGDGVMGNTAMYQAAWQLDPYFVANSRFATSSGGGRGSYTFADQVQNPAQVPPGDARWGGNYRREHGGRGGHPLAPDASSRLSFGGGGGGGESNNGQGGAGGNGGGIIFLSAKRITATAGGCMSADGASGGSATGDGAGGGGGGGSVIIGGPQVSGVAVSALGGKGGDNLFPLSGVFGSAGGGGGGFVAPPLGSVIQPTVSGGAAGVASSPTLASFPLNGATNGGDGVVKPYGGLLPVCLPADLSLTLTGSAAMVRINVPVYFTVMVMNQGPEDADNVRVTISVPPNTTVASDPSGEGWTCTLAGSAYTCTIAILASGARAPVLQYILAARPETPTQIVTTAQVTADTTDPNLNDNTGSVSVEIDRTELHGGGASCNATGAGARGDQAPAGALGLLVALGALFRRMRRSAGAHA